MKFQSTNFTLHCASLPSVLRQAAVQVLDRLAENPKLEQNEIPKLERFNYNSRLISYRIGLAYLGWCDETREKREQSIQFVNEKMKTSFAENWTYE